MNALHVHGKVTPTSRVVRSVKSSKSPFDRPSPTKARTSRKLNSPLDSQVTSVAVPLTHDFSGLDVLSAMEYLKQLQHDLPPRLSRDAKTALLVRRQHMPPIVLAHQITSLFPNLPTLERDLLTLARNGDIVRLTVQDGEVAYIKRRDYNCPQALLETPLTALSDEQVRVYSQQGWLLRRHGSIVLSVPHLGTFFSALKAARKYVLMILRNGIVLQKDVKARYENWKDGGMFQFQHLLHDLVGGSRIEVLELTVGRALRITKRGRDFG